MVSAMNNPSGRLEAKRLELESIVAETCGEYSSSGPLLSAVNDALFQWGAITMTPPQEEPVTLGFMLIDPLQNYSSGASIKPGNITLNIKQLIHNLPDLAWACDSLFRDAQFLKIMAFFRIWTLLRNTVTIPITKRQAIVILTLWKNCGSNHRITVEQGFEQSNLLCRQIEEPEFQEWEYSKILDDLSHIGSVELDEKGIWLREWVRYRYT